jgi:hypothetical protein
MDSGKVVASLSTAADMDDMFFDAGRKRIYVAGGEGFLSVVQQGRPLRRHGEIPNRARRPHRRVV